MLNIADYGRGLPDEFYDGLYKQHDEPPSGCQVGHLVKDYGREGGWRLARFSASTSDGVGKLWVGNRRKIYGTTDVGVNQGQRYNVMVDIGASLAAALGEFKRGIMLVVSGVIAGQRFFIENNEAKDANNRVALQLDRAVPQNMSKSDRVMLLSHKYMNVQVATDANDDDEAKTPIGASLIASPTATKYGWLQSLGVGPAVGEAAFGNALQDGTPLIQGLDGQLKLQRDSGANKPTVAYLNRDEDATNTATTAGGIISVEWAIPTEW